MYPSTKLSCFFFKAGLFLYTYFNYVYVYVGRVGDAHEYSSLEDLKWASDPLELE